LLWRRTVFDILDRVMPRVASRQFSHPADNACVRFETRADNREIRRSRLPRKSANHGDAE
jgi:hypothetical protein